MKTNSIHTQDFSAPIQKYLRNVARRLNMPYDVKSRVISDLATSIRARIEQGESEEAILSSLDSPVKAASELNEQMKDFTYRQSPWRFAFLALAVLAVLWLVVSLIVPQIMMVDFITPDAATIGIIGGADGPTSIFVATAPSDLVAETIVCALLIVASVFGYIKLKWLKK